MKKSTNEKIYLESPSEARYQIDSALIDDLPSIKDATTKDILKEIRWTVERMEMDIAEGIDTEFATQTIKECNKVLRKYKKYE